MTFALRQSVRRHYNLTSSPHSLFTRLVPPTSPIPLSIRLVSSKGIPPLSKITQSVPLEAMEAVKQTAAQNFGVSGAHGLVPEDQRFTLEQTPDLSGKVAVVTGK